jgi:hypothetical protein
VKRKSTNLTSLSFTSCITSATVLAISNSCSGWIGEKLVCWAMQIPCHHLTRTRSQHPES